MANAINLDNDATLNMAKLYMVKDLLDSVKQFIEQVYFVDVCAIGAMYADWLNYGAASRTTSRCPICRSTRRARSSTCRAARSSTATSPSVKPITSFEDPYFQKNVVGVRSRTPGTTVTGRGIRTKRTRSRSTPTYEADNKYSWIKAPRFDGQPMQVGPLAQVLVGFAQGHEPTTRWATKTLATAGKVAGDDAHAGGAALDARPPRRADDPHRGHLRARRQALAAARRQHRQGRHTIFNQPVFPKGEQQGFGFHEAPRGTLSHWVVIEDGKIKNYQAVVPSTWNAGPRDEKNQPGPYEASLVGNPVADPERPLEVLRTIHSFDPCIACAIHTLDVDGREIARVRVL